MSYSTAIEPDDASSIPRTHMGKQRTNSLRSSYDLLTSIFVMCDVALTHTQNNKKAWGGGGPGNVCVWPTHIPGFQCCPISEQLTIKSKD